MTMAKISKKYCKHCGAVLIHMMGGREEYNENTGKLEYVEGYNYWVCPNKKGGMYKDFNKHPKFDDTPPMC